MSDVISLATEDAVAQRARAELERVAKLCAREAAMGLPLDEVIAGLKRVCEEQERALLRKRRRGKTWSESVEEIYRRAHVPWVRVCLGSHELASVRLGSFMTLIGPEGSGKSSLAVQIAAQHERDAGPAIYVTPELDHDEGVGRVIGQDIGASWREVLTGEVPRDMIPERRRWRTIERDDATLFNLAVEIQAIREEYGDEPILVVWDYLQASPGESEGERLRIARLSSEMRRFAKRHQVVILGVSQTSRAGAQQLDSGELLGTAASRTGAESSQIERDSYVVLSIGDRRERPDGREDRSISRGKYRMGAGNVVLEAIYDGRTGLWTVESEPRPVAEVIAARKEAAGAGKIKAAELAMLALAEKAAEPLTREVLRGAAATKAAYAQQALVNLIARGDLVEVDRRRPRSRSYMVWTRSNAEAAGVPILGDSEVA